MFYNCQDFYIGVARYLISEKNLNIDEKIKQLESLLKKFPDCYNPNSNIKKAQATAEMEHDFNIATKQFGEKTQNRMVDWVSMRDVYYFFKDDTILPNYFKNTIKLLEKKLKEVNEFYSEVNTELKIFHSKLSSEVTINNIQKLRDKYQGDNNGYFNTFSHFQEVLQKHIDKIVGILQKESENLDAGVAFHSGNLQGTPKGWFKSWYQSLTLEASNLVNYNFNLNHRYLSDIDDVLDLKDDILNDAQSISKGQNVSKIQKELLDLEGKTIYETCNKAYIALNKLRDQFTLTSRADFVVYEIYKKDPQKFQKVTETVNWARQASNGAYNEAKVYNDVLFQGVKGLLNYIDNKNMANAFKDLCDLFNSKGIHNGDHLEQMVDRLSKIWGKTRTIKRFKLR
jgi:hypothetical protein